MPDTQENTHPIKVGAVVRLKSGSPAMTVTHAFFNDEEDACIHCIYTKGNPLEGELGTVSDLPAACVNVVE